jgi:hypothetical protein
MLNLQPAPDGGRRGRAYRCWATAVRRTANSVGGDVHVEMSRAQAAGQTAHYRTTSFTASAGGGLSPAFRLSGTFDHAD